jgi:hypothetical protein
VTRHEKVAEVLAGVIRGRLAGGPGGVDHPDDENEDPHADIRPASYVPRLRPREDEEDGG